MKRVLIKLDALRETAKRRPAGYLADVMLSGQVSGNAVILELADYKALCRRYRRLYGLGDLIAKLTGWLRIQPCEGCKRRQRTLNKLFPFRHVPKSRR